MEVADELKQALGEKLIEHESLGQHTTMRVGGVADFFYPAETIDELVKAVQTAINIKIPYFILGGGSNIIVSDYGYPGLVIANKTSNVAFLTENAQAIVDSGVYLGHLITKAAGLGLSGLEFLIGIPGTVGGAIYNNVSCWDNVFGDYVRSITLLAPPDQLSEKCQVINIDSDWMKFSYHSSQLKELSKSQNGRNPVILTAKIQLAHLRREEIMRRIQHYQNLRAEKQPVGVFTSGCIFKNPSGQAGGALTDEERKQMSAGFLIDNAGGKRIKVDGASVSKKHANFIVNNGKAKAIDIRALIERIRDLVREKHGVLLEEEVEYLGKWPQDTTE